MLLLTIHPSCDPVVMARVLHLIGDVYPTATATAHPDGTLTVELPPE